MYKIVKAECLADKIYLMDVEAPRVAKDVYKRQPLAHGVGLGLPGRA